jgi:hypothetical protein
LEIAISDSDDFNLTHFVSVNTSHLRDRQRRTSQGRWMLLRVACWRFRGHDDKIVIAVELDLFSRRLPSPASLGRWRGMAFIQDGRSALRQALYMPAVVACRFTPDLDLELFRGAPS